MASITIRNLDPAVKDRLRVRAAEHGRSMEEEARLILRRVVVEREAADASDWHHMAGPKRGSAHETLARRAETLLEIGRAWNRGADLGGVRSEDHAELYGEDGLPR